MELDIQKSASACHCPDRQMEKCEEAVLRHRSFYPFDPEGQGGGARHPEKRKRLSLPRQANGEKRGGSSSATGAFIHLTPRGKAVELDIQKSASACHCPDRQMGKSEEAVPQPPELLSI
ncbi:hypothetical protein [Psychrobacillus sp. MER TA 171]|uniref:hypothetical protein n=1 Tax=Psychrobacillus sp. MER TA 171 TaxID=2939577 RepID=UPI00203FC715|nr:hypothetical protein [Psychrobacillus sp. MER TA 171]